METHVSFRACVLFLCCLRSVEKSFRQYCAHEIFTHEREKTLGSGRVEKGLSPRNGQEREKKKKNYNKRSAAVIGTFLCAMSSFWCHERGSKKGMFIIPC